MHGDKTQKDTAPPIRDLYPHFTEAELKEAEENLERYLELTLRIYERIQADPQAYAHFKVLTASQSGRTMKGKGRTKPNHTDFPTNT